jgi:hypothetical protein
MVARAADALTNPTIDTIQDEVGRVILVEIVAPTEMVCEFAQMVVERTCVERFERPAKALV